MKKLFLPLFLLCAGILSAEVPPAHDCSYVAKVSSVYDGDTYTVDIYLGLGVWLHDQKIRLLGYDTPEVRGDSREAGLVSRDFVRDLMNGKTVILRTPNDQKGKYGRWLADVSIEVEGKQADLGELLLNKGLARRVTY